MSTYMVGTYEFIKWEGVRPQFTKQHVLAFRKPATDGITALLQGTNGDQFSVTLTAVLQTDNDLKTRENELRGLIGSVQKIVYEGTDWQTEYAVDFLVMDYINRAAKKQAIATGPGYCWYNAWHLMVEFTFIPVAHSAG